MNYTDLANPGVFDQPMYIPGKPLNAVAKEYGLKIDFERHIGKKLLLIKLD